MAKYRKKPIEVDAIQWTGDNRTTLQEFAGAYITFGGVTLDRAYVQTLHGVVTLAEGDWLVRGPSRDFWPVKPDIFDESYEAVNDGEETGEGS